MLFTLSVARSFQHCVCTCNFLYSTRNLCQLYQTFPFTMTSIIGSVFLGDRHRVRSTSSKSTTPPSSPPGTAISAIFPGFPPQSPPPMTNQKGIDPAMALEIRLRWLEAIVYGVRKGKEPEKRGELKYGETLSRVTDNLQHQLQSVVENHDGLKKFMSSCKLSLELVQLDHCRRSARSLPYSIVCSVWCLARATVVRKYDSRRAGRFSYRNGERHTRC